MSKGAHGNHGRAEGGTKQGEALLGMWPVHASGRSYRHEEDPTHGGQLEEGHGIARLARLEGRPPLDVDPDAGLVQQWLKLPFEFVRLVYEFPLRRGKGGQRWPDGRGN